jgi:hypothetical protein
MSDEIDDILSGKQAPRAGPPPGLRDDDSLLVSRRVTRPGGAVLWAYRDTELGPADSGWVLMTGTEPDREAEDRGCFEERTVAWALDFDPSLASILGAPPESCFERDGPDEPWVELEDG